MVKRCDLYIASDNRRDLSKIHISTKLGAPVTLPRRLMYKLFWRPPFAHWQFLGVSKKVKC